MKKFVPDWDEDGIDTLANAIVAGDELFLARVARSDFTTWPEY